MYHWWPSHNSRVISVQRHLNFCAAPICPSYSKLSISIDVRTAVPAGQGILVYLLSSYSKTSANIFTEIFLAAKLSIEPI